MTIPQKVNQAVKAIWFTIVASAVSATIEAKLGYLGGGEFIFTLILYGIFCVIPYKIEKGSNAARYIFTILCVLGYLFLLGSSAKDLHVQTLDVVLSIVLIPVYIFIFYQLFSKEANDWFNQKK